MKTKPTRPIPIRLDDEVTRRIDSAAKKMGCSRSAIMRLGIINQLPEIEAGRIILNSAQ